ncbi:mechanosensitive ion channel family protein [Vaginisenegalia massiliensis]|uniref:mechanosensitive ion channel family protein n=1 Tax=Vaginisenegalia massiliensis TaxID=2058294 RepID=UPI000F54ACD6|nr:mechanosensitive ion channel family protein [Vaginisenegalia massiliensis]
MNKYWHLMTQNIWLYKLVWSLLWLIIITVSLRALNRVWRSQITDPNKFYRFRKSTYYVGTLLYIVIMFFVWFELAGSLTVYLGFLSAGIAISLKDFFANIFAWFFIVLRRPFRVGDRIFINGQRGDVIDIRMFHFSLIEVSAPEDGEQSTGCMVDVPNHFVFLYPIVNLVKGFEYIWHELEVKLTSDSDWRQAKRDFEQIVLKHTKQYITAAQEEVELAAQKYMIYYNNFTPIVYTQVTSDGISLTLRYLCSPKMKRNTSNDIWESILDYVAQHETVKLK